jgi:hypothetical protein
MLQAGRSQVRVPKSGRSLIHDIFWCRNPGNIIHDWSAGFWLRDLVVDTRERGVHHDEVDFITTFFVPKPGRSLIQDRTQKTSFVRLSTQDITHCQKCFTQPAVKYTEKENSTAPGAWCEYRWYTRQVKYYMFNLFLSVIEHDLSQSASNFMNKCRILTFGL